MWNHTAIVVASFAAFPFYWRNFLYILAFYTNIHLLRKKNIYGNFFKNSQPMSQTVQLIMQPTDVTYYGNNRSMGYENQAAFFINSRRSTIFLAILSAVLVMSSGQQNHAKSLIASVA